MFCLKLNALLNFALSLLLLHCYFANIAVNIVAKAAENTAVAHSISQPPPLIYPDSPGGKITTLTPHSPL